MSINLIKAYQTWQLKQQISQCEALIRENLHPLSLNVETADRYARELVKLKSEWRNKNALDNRSYQEHYYSVGCKGLDDLGISYQVNIAKCNTFISNVAKCNPPTLQTLQNATQPTQHGDNNGTG